MRPDGRDERRADRADGLAARHLRPAGDAFRRGLRRPQQPLAATRDAAGHPVLGGIVVKGLLTCRRRDRCVPPAAAHRAAAGGRSVGDDLMRCPAASPRCCSSATASRSWSRRRPACVLAEVPPRTMPRRSAPRWSRRGGLRTRWYFPGGAMMPPAPRRASRAAADPAGVSRARPLVGPMLGLGRMAFNETGRPARWCRHGRSHLRARCSTIRSPSR